MVAREAGSLRGEPVDIRSTGQLIAVGAKHVAGVIVGNQKE
jgi:hypothetical protein